MYLTPAQTLLTILAIALGTQVTRGLPFLLFPENKPVPRYVVFLGNALPGAMMGLLVVYCLKGVNLLRFPHGLPELISIAVITALHLWRRNVLLSIAAGTIVYMALVQTIFIP